MCLRYCFCCRFLYAPVRPEFCVLVRILRCGSCALSVSFSLWCSFCALCVCIRACCLSVRCVRALSLFVCYYSCALCVACSRVSLCSAHSCMLPACILCGDSYALSVSLVLFILCALCIRVCYLPRHNVCLLYLFSCALLFLCAVCGLFPYVPVFCSFLHVSCVASGFVPACILFHSVCSMYLCVLFCMMCVLFISVCCVGLFPCAPVFRIFRVLNYSEHLSLWRLSVSSVVSISECPMYLCVLCTSV